jgi:class 3 adenylate cyclase
VGSLQIKFSAVLVVLLLAAGGGLTWLATQHERAALTLEVGQRGRVLARSLSGSAAEPLLAGDDLRLEALVQELRGEAGVVGVRILSREGDIQASLGEEERGRPGRPIARTSAEPVVVREGARLLVGASVVYSDVRVGEAQVELDLDALVAPVVAETARQLGGVALGVVVLGVAAGLGFVALLVGPLRRLRSGVERLSAGDLSVRVAPSSNDEVGELTRAFNEMGESLQQKERLQSAFGRYVNDYVVDRLLESGDDVQLGGAEREITILFADIRRFTRLSEGMKASDVVSLLNEVFQLASDRILARGGIIDKYMGDSVMAYFGAPLPQADHAVRAVAAAIDIQEALAERRADAAPDSALASVELGVGIHTGSVVVGNIGSEQRADFTAVGDAVNVAHRLEKLARPGEVLISEAVQRRVRDAFRLRFEGEQQLSGRQEPVHTYVVEGLTSAPAVAPAVGSAGTA